jgi:hypothetical protein
LPPTAHLNLVSGVYVFNNSLFVADIGDNRVLIWSKFPESELDEPDIVLGQPDFISQYPTNSKDKLFMPAYLCFDRVFFGLEE